MRSFSKTRRLVVAVAPLSVLFTCCQTNGRNTTPSHADDAAPGSDETADASKAPDGNDDEADSGDSVANGSGSTAEALFADVIDVAATGSAGNYSFAVTVQSPDTGCDRYADYWEVIDAEQNLLYRRILLHSHVTEQPFQRSGSPVEIAETDEVIVRAHLSTTGYGGAAMSGSVNAGFSPIALEPGFAAALSDAPPQVESCAF